jgi:hypothetical protein
MGLLFALLLLFGVIQYNPIITSGQSNFMKMNNVIVGLIVLIYGIYLVKKKK